MSRRNAWSEGGVEEPRPAAKLYILLNAPGTEPRYLLERTSPDVICLLFFHFNWTEHTNRRIRKKVYRGLWGVVAEGGGGRGNANIKTYPINAALLNISSAPLFAEWPPSVRPLNEMKSVGKCFIYRIAPVAIMSRCVYVWRRAQYVLIYHEAAAVRGPATFLLRPPPPHKLREIYLYLWRCQ